MHFFKHYVRWNPSQRFDVRRFWFLRESNRVLYILQIYVVQENVLDLLVHFKQKISIWCAIDTAGQVTEFSATDMEAFRPTNRGRGGEDCNKSQFSEKVYQSKISKFVNLSVISSLLLSLALVSVPWLPYMYQVHSTTVVQKEYRMFYLWSEPWQKPLFWK